jgi:hypothetical protein
MVRSESPKLKKNSDRKGKRNVRRRKEKLERKPRCMKGHGRKN